jgi:chemotaxis protein CheC
MKLPSKQREALSELINIGYGRAAAALCELTGQRVSLEVPQVELFFINEIGLGLREVFKEEVWSVHQFFSGRLKGHAMLLADEKAALTLSQLIVREELRPGEDAAAAREVLEEVGNILLRGAVGICGDLLRMEVSFSVPRLRIESVDDLLNSVTVQTEEVQYALMVRTRFRIVSSQVSGYLVLILGVTSFTRMMEALDQWEAAQSQEEVQSARGRDSLTIKASRFPGDAGLSPA